MSDERTFKAAEMLVHAGALPKLRGHMPDCGCSHCGQMERVAAMLRQGAAAAEREAALVAENERLKGELADARHEHIQLLRNSGVDTDCGACMEVAYTGVTTNGHSCVRKESALAAELQKVQRYGKALLTLCVETNGEGQWHADECPGDDTCDCLFAHVNAAVNDAYRDSEALGLTPAPPAVET